jgi:hypothetical protein
MTVASFLFSALLRYHPKNSIIKTHSRQMQCKEIDFMLMVGFGLSTGVNHACTLVSVKYRYYATLSLSLSVKFNSIYIIFLCSKRGLKNIARIHQRSLRAPHKVFELLNCSMQTKPQRREKITYVTLNFHKPLLSLSLFCSLALILSRAFAQPLTHRLEIILYFIICNVWNFRETELCLPGKIIFLLITK